MKYLSGKTVQSLVEERLHDFSLGGRSRFLPASSRMLSALADRIGSVPACQFAVRARRGVLVTCLIGLQLVPAFAWVFPEHRNITVLAVERLNPEQQALLQGRAGELHSRRHPPKAQGAAQLRFEQESPDSALPVQN